MNAMKRTMFLTFLAAAPLLAQQPPDGPSSDDRPPSTRESHFGGGEHRFFGAPRVSDPSEQEQEGAAAFMKRFAPNRWAAMEAMPENSAARRGVMAFAVARWHHLQFLREEDPGLYDIKVKELVAEDGIFGLLATTRSPAERMPLRKQLREKAGDLVKLGLAEREHRIERLQQDMKAEEDRLAQDRKDLESLTDRRTDSLIADGPIAGRPEGYRRPHHDGPTTRPDGAPVPRDAD